MLAPDSLGTLLLREHRRLEMVFSELLEACRLDSWDVVAEQWGAFDATLEAHFSLEETQILPTFAEVDAVKSRALIAEHEALRRKLIELGVAVDLHAARLTMIEDFVARLSTHAAREEALLYRWVDQGLSSVAKAQLRAELLERQHELPAGSVIFEEGHESAQQALGEVTTLLNLHSYQQAAKRFGQLRRDLEQHLTDEEDVILPSYVEHTGDVASAEAIRAEHQRLRSWAEELGGAISAPDHPSVAKQLTAFEQAFEEHCGIEEHVLTRSLHEVLPSAQAWHEFIAHHRPRGERSRVNAPVLRGG